MVVFVFIVIFIKVEIGYCGSNDLYLFFVIFNIEEIIIFIDYLNFYFINVFKFYI